MVLLISSLKLDEVPDSSRSLYQLAPHLKEGAAALTATPIKQLGPQGLIYVSQREFAVVSPHDKNITIIGTDDFTTCLSVVLRHPGSGAISIAHFDSNCISGISTMVARLQDLSMGYFDQGHIEMHLVGSFSDNRGLGEDVFYSLMQHVAKEPYDIELVSACLGQANTILRGDTPWPILYGIGVDIKSGEIFPATFLDKGPDLPLRGARIFSGSSALLEIYDYSSGLLRIGPFHYEPLRCAPQVLQESDEFILNHLTTSPEVEPAHVVSEIKATLRHIQAHPFPEITIFTDNRPRYYRKEINGQWTLVRVDPFRYESIS